MSGVMPEDEIQIELASRLDAAGILWCHVPNEGRCSKREGGRRKARGVKAGVPDFLIFDPPPASESEFAGGRAGAALEIKREDESPSAWKPHQRKWAADLAARGWATAVAYGLDAALAQLRAWGYTV